MELTRTYHVAFVTEQGVSKKYGRNRREMKVQYGRVDAHQRRICSISTR
ncbi:hypothetical protein F3D3_4485 [Fusibacter sp. 3D3]|nr:hypothetical protein F3D3_4485 [Fusibacter sp. 3D3]